MSMSTHVVAFKPPDEKWKKMKAVYDACGVAGIYPPKEVTEFFNGYAPSEAGVEISQRDLERRGVIKKWSDNGASGFELDITKLPPNVTIIRFYNSW